MKTAIRKKKSEPLTKDEFKALQKYVFGHHTVTDAAEGIGITREVLNRVRIAKSASPTTIAKIRKTIANL